MSPGGGGRGVAGPRDAVDTAADDRLGGPRSADDEEADEGEVDALSGVGQTQAPRATSTTLPCLEGHRAGQGAAR